MADQPVAGPAAPTTVPQATPRRQILSGSLWTAPTFLITALGGPALTVALVRLMPHRQYGELAVAISCVGVVRVLSGFGLNNASARLAAVAAREHGAGGIRATLGTGLRVSTVVAVASVPGYVVLVLIADELRTLHPAVPALLAMAPIVLLAAYVEVGTGFLRAIHRPRAVTAVTAVGTVVTVGLTLAVVLLAARTAVAVSAVRSIGAAATAAGFGIVLYVWARGLPAAQGPATDWRRFISFGGATVLTGLATAAVVYLDVLVLGAVDGARSVANYAPASALAAVILGLPVIIGAFFLPVISRAAAASDHEEVRRLYHWSSRWNLALAAPAISVLLVCPSSIMRILFGGSYGMSGGALRVLGLGVAVQVAFGYNGLTLEAYGVPGVVARREALALVVSAVACLALVPPLGMTGAAWATTAALVFANVSCSQVLRTRFGLPPWDRPLIATLGGLAVLAGLSALAVEIVSGDVGRVGIAVLAGLLTAAVAFAVSDPADRAMAKGYLAAIPRKHGKHRV